MAPPTLGALMIALVASWIAFGVPAAWASIKRPGGFSDQLGLRFERRDLLYGPFFGLVGQLLVYFIYLPVHLLNPELANSVSDAAEETTSAAHGLNWIPMVISAGAFGSAL